MSSNGPTNTLNSSPTKDQRQLNGETAALSANGAGTTGHSHHTHRHTNEPKLDLTFFTIINSKQIIDFN